MRRSACFLLLALAGCAMDFPRELQDLERYSEARTLAPGKATLLVIHADSVGSKHGAYRVVVGGARVGQLRDAEYIEVPVAPGFTAMRVDCRGCTYPSMQFTGTFQAGRTYSFQVRGEETRSVVRTFFRPVTPDGARALLLQYHATRMQAGS